MRVSRSDNNPILKPNRNNSWEAEAVFNGCPIKKGNKIFMVYRALSNMHYHTSAATKMMVSDIGIAESSDGLAYTNRRRFIVPEFDWEKFGCEDPRITELDGKYYVFYTALSHYPFRAEGIKCALAISTDLEKVTEKHEITPFNAKGMTLFPKKINGKYWVMLTLHTDMPPAKICLASFDKEEDMWSQEHWEKWYRDFGNHTLELTREGVDQVEVGAPPILTEYGWLVIYSYIKNYFSNHKEFTIEAVLLNKDNPLEILARTEVPILSTEEQYERVGIVPNIVFPSGALVEGENLNIYYGAADTTVCVATVELASLLDLMLQKEKRIVNLERSSKNPIISYDKKHDWESGATFNPAAIYLDNKVHILYRALSKDNTSTMGYASSTDGITIDERLDKPVYEPREGFEKKLEANILSGCEDPRLTKIGDKIYMCYTAYDGRSVPRVALTSILEKDFLSKNWKWEKPVLISPPDCDDKDAFVFPEKVDGKYMIVHRSGIDMDYSMHDNLNFDGETWLEEYRWITPRHGWWDSKKVGAAAPPIKTDDGWVFLYHGVSDTGVYRVGAILLDLKDPTKVIGRTDNPIFEPKEHYELTGDVPNVVFPCGNVLIKDTVYVYYGGGDKVIGVATVKLEELVRVLKLCKW